MLLVCIEEAVLLLAANMIPESNRFIVRQQVVIVISEGFEVQFAILSLVKILLGCVQGKRCVALVRN